jgi:hypothetical protein
MKDDGTFAAAAWRVHIGREFHAIADGAAEVVQKLYFVNRLGGDILHGYLLVKGLA